MTVALRKLFKRMIAVALLCAVLVAMPLAHAYANPVVPDFGALTSSDAPTGNAARSADLEIEDAEGNRVKCSDYGALTGAIVPCVMHNIETTGVKIAEEFTKLLEPVVGAFLTLVIIFFGVKTVQGEGQAAQKAVLLILKIAFVFGFLEIMPSLIPQMHAAMRESTTTVASVLSSDDFHCEYTVKPGGDLLWAQMDCLIGKLFGFVTSDSGQPNMLLAASGFGLMAGFMFGGTAGLFVFFAILGVLYTLLTFVWKTLLAYINGFIVATLLIILAPLFLPMALMQVTAQYFDKWWKGILAAMLMPILITGYVMLALMLYDKVLLADDSLVQNLFNEDLMAEMQNLNQQVCAPTGTNDQSTRVAANTAEGITQEDAIGSIRNHVFLLQSGNAAGCVGVDNIQMPTEMLERIFYDLAKILITTIVVSSGFTVIQGSARNITGSSMVSAAIEPVSTWEVEASKAMQGARRGMENATDDNGNRIGDMKGMDFVTNLPNILRGGAFGMMGQQPPLSPRSAAAAAPPPPPPSPVTRINELLATEHGLDAQQRTALTQLRGRLNAGQGNTDEAMAEIERIITRE
jgi:hypothetical protein